MFAIRTGARAASRADHVFDIDLAISATRLGLINHFATAASAAPAPAATADLAYTGVHAPAAPRPVGPEPEHNGSGDPVGGVAATGNQAIDALLIGTRWSDGFITYANTDSAADYQAGYNSDQNGNGISAQFEGFSAFSNQQVLALHTALNSANFGQLSAFAGLSVEGFTNLGIDYQGAGAGNATIRAANSSDAGTAYAFYPSASVYGGDTFVGPNARTPTAGNYSWHTMFHELGHSLGLKHGHETGGFGALPSNVDSLEFSIMTYRTYIGDNTSGYNYETWGAPQTFMMLDIAALQTLYGADYSANAGNTVYTWDPNTGETIINSSIALDPGGNRIFMTVWDGGGYDTYDLSNYTSNCEIDLNAGGYCDFNSGQNAFLGGGPNGGYARGNVFNALLFGGNTASLIEAANGGSGNDTIVGNQIGNNLRGNAGGDALYGLDGSDTLVGGVGNDYLDGGAGDDLVDYFYETGGVTVNASAGTASGAAGNDTLVNIESVYGTVYNDVLTGTSAASGYVRGSGGDDYIYAVLGTDNLDGGSGTDTVDTTLFSGDYVIDLATGATNFSFEIMTSFENAVTAGGNDVVSGTAGANWIRTDGGNDVLNGLDGDDRLDGGVGDDTLDGGNGIDVADYGNAGAGVTVNAQLTSAQATGGAGTDTLLGIEALIGSAYDDVLTGTGFSGGYVRAGAGNDYVYAALGFDDLDGGSGIDTVDGSLFSGDYEINLTTGLTNYGGETMINFENATTGAGNDRLTGDAGANVLAGGSGNDVLAGLLGDDTMNGGAGLDTADYRAAGSGVTVSLAVATAQNTIGAGVDTLVEIERLEGSKFADVLSGSRGSNRVNGNQGNDAVSGGKGADLLIGGGGSDALTGGIGKDTLTGGLGRDTFLFGVKDSFGKALDLVSDFDTATDRIDLSALSDAVGATLDFIGNAAFSGVAGELRFRADGADTRVLVDLDGDGTADFAIRFTGTIAFQANDFVLT